MIVEADQSCDTSLEQPQAMIGIITRVSLVVGVVIFVIVAHVLIAVVFVALFLVADCYFTPLNDETLAEDLKLIHELSNVGDNLMIPRTSMHVERYYTIVTDRDYALLERVIGPGMHTRLGDDNERQYDYVEIGHATHVLEIGCGKGHSQVLARRYTGVHFTGVDIVAQHIAAAKAATADLNNVEYIQADATVNLSWLGQRKFQVIFGVESLRHIDTEDKMAYFVEQARALLAPGGKLVIVDIFRSAGFADAKTDQQMAMMLAEHCLFCTSMPSKQDWIRTVGMAPGVDINLTADAMPFWVLWWRIARLLLHCFACFSSILPDLSDTAVYSGLNLISLCTMAHALRGAAEYGVLEFEFQ